jgi:hypothetical protein
MEKNRFFVSTVMVLLCCTGLSQASMWINNVTTTPLQPLDTDSITLNISGIWGGSPVIVSDQFLQNGTSLQLDLYFPYSMIQIIDFWKYSKEIQPLSPGIYNLEVDAYGYDSHGVPDLADTYTTSFTVTPEPCGLALFGIGVPFMRAILKQNRSRNR